MMPDFDAISPLDYRYYDEETAAYLSEEAAMKYRIKLELALVEILHRRSKCSASDFKEIREACAQVTAAEVYEEENRIKHDIRALVNCICKRVSPQAARVVHLGATSYDIISSAEAARFRDVTRNILLPALKELLKVLANLTIEYADTVQVGRTHGQHASPITFGFALAGYVSRIGNSYEMLTHLSGHLPGKFSGAVGTYNAPALLFDDPERFEEEVLWEVGLFPAEHSTQIVPPDQMARLLCEVTITSGILANLADDMRHLQRSEIAEVGETFDAQQVGSSTMPHKQNPINFENASSCFKIIIARIITVLMDLRSEHQRDLTNSMSSRTNAEMVAYLISMVKRLTRTLKKLKFHTENADLNLELQHGLILAEPLYILLSSVGCPEAHEKVRKITLEARKNQIDFQEAIRSTDEIRPYLEMLTPAQRATLQDPHKYTGIAAGKAHKIAGKWKERLQI